jgi:hypothetical protein
MTDQTQLLREAIKRLLKAHRITTQTPPKTTMEAEAQIAEIQAAVQAAESALSAPAQPASGKMLYQVAQMDGSWLDADREAAAKSRKSRIVYTTPPASQEQV